MAPKRDVFLDKNFADPTIKKSGLFLANLDTVQLSQTGTLELGAAAHVALYQEGQGGAKVPFQFKGLPWRNSKLSEILVHFFYEFASENARNAGRSFPRVAGDGWRVAGSG